MYPAVELSTDLKEISNQIVVLLYVNYLHLRACNVLIKCTTEANLMQLSSMYSTLCNTEKWIVGIVGTQTC